MRTHGHRPWYRPSDATCDLEELLAAAVDATRVTADEILATTRGEARTARARHAFCLAAARVGWSLTDIGRFLGRNHSTILRGQRVAEADDVLCQLAERIRKAVGGARVDVAPITPEDELADEGVWRREYPHLHAKGITAAKWREAIGCA